MEMQILRWTFALGLVALAPAWSLGQQPAPFPSRPRLAEGILKVFPPTGEEEETFTGPLAMTSFDATYPVVEGDPVYVPLSETLREISKQVILRREIWNLEFACKPMRMIKVAIPTGDGGVAEKRLWYLVYRVRYLGNDLAPSPEKDRYGHVRYPATTAVNRTFRRFFPQLVLLDVDRKESYMDRVIPAAMGPIARRERVGKQLHNSVDISLAKVELSDGRTDNGVWGVAVWEDIDPRVDRFCVLINGLTNAYQLQPDAAGQLQLERKTLKLNFWRPGDSVLEHEDEIRLGIPFEGDAVKQADVLKLYGESKRVEYSWIYR